MKAPHQSENTDKDKDNIQTIRELCPLGGVMLSTLYFSLRFRGYDETGALAEVMELLGSSIVRDYQPIL